MGEGLSVINNDDQINTIGELVNRKRGKHCQKGHRATVPLEVVGVDISYGDSPVIGGHKYVLILVDQCKTESFSRTCADLLVLIFVRHYGHFY